MLIDTRTECAKAINIQVIRKWKTLQIYRILYLLLPHATQETERFTILSSEHPTNKIIPKYEKSIRNALNNQNQKQSNSSKKILTRSKLPSTTSTTIVKKCGRFYCVTRVNSIEDTTYRCRSEQICTVK